jgi:hypothetical protein
MYPRRASRRARRRARAARDLAPAGAVVFDDPDAAAPGARAAPSFRAPGAVARERSCQLAEVSLSPLTSARE